MDQESGNQGRITFSSSLKILSTYITTHWSWGKIFSTTYDKDVARAKLALWYIKIEEYGYDTFTTVANSIENHYERILNFFVNRSTNAAAEAFNAKIKAFRASFRGVVDRASSFLG